MATAKISMDKYANLITIEIPQSTANETVMKKLTVPNSIFDKWGAVIHRVEYNFHSPPAHWPRDATLMGAITVFTSSDQIASAGSWTTNVRRPEVIDHVRVHKIGDPGTLDTAVRAGELREFPIVHDYTGLPNGGLIVPPDQLSGYIQATSMTGAATLIIRVWFTGFPLAAADYWELVEARRTITNLT